MLLASADGAQAKADFLNHLLDPGETWIIAYAFTLTDMINDLIAAHNAGLPLHLYLDHSQAIEAVEKPLVQQLVSAGVEVTIGTSPAGSQYICHTKGMVSDPAANGGSLWCWEGSTNFSLSAGEVCVDQRAQHAGDVRAASGRGQSTRGDARAVGAEGCAEKRRWCRDERQVNG